MVCFHRERNAFPFVVNTHYLDPHLLVNAHHLRGMLDVAVSQLREVYESALFDADVHKGSEVGDIVHDARQLHTYLEVIQCTNMLIEGKVAYLSARVTSRLL